jgi:3-oxoadipate enol-lactonase
MGQLKTAIAPDSTELKYQIEGAGPIRIALVHSLAMDHSFWQPVLERLRGDAQLLVWDCRGHGKSGKGEGPYTVELFADDLAAVLNHAGWTSAIVAGASMGGCVSLAFAAQYASRCQALGLIDTTAWYGETATRDWEMRAQKALAEGLAGLTGFQITRWFGEGFRAREPEAVARCVAVFLANAATAYAETCRMLGAADLRSVLPRISVPTAITVGEEDYATPLVMAQNLHAAIVGSTLEVLQGARHLTPLECPDRIAAALKKLIERAEQR